jgi:hypothetical protein
MVSKDPSRVRNYLRTDAEAVTSDAEIMAIWDAYPDASPRVVASILYQRWQGPWSRVF